MTSLDPLERVVSTLARDPNLPRIKKLLYCACYGVWEDNTARLNQVSLQEIVQGVWERSPTLEALQFQLNRVVKTLNKPVAYAHVANAVLQVLNDLYFDNYDITQPVMVNRVQFPLSTPGGVPGSISGSPHDFDPPPVPGQPDQGYSSPGYPSVEPAQPGDVHAVPQGNIAPYSLSRNDFGEGQQQSSDSAYAAHPHHYPNHPTGYAQPQPALDEAPATQWFAGGPQDSGSSALTPAQLSAQTAVRAHVMQSLSQHREQRRMKKLLVCVCHNQWENNRSHLTALDWELLLDEARRLMPTLPGLEHVLQAIVNSLSKPVEYLKVAQELLEIVTPLYEQERPDETQFFGVTPEPSTRVAEQRPVQPHYPLANGPINGPINGAISRPQVAPSQTGPTYPPSISANIRTSASQAQPLTRGGIVRNYAIQPERRNSDISQNPPLHPSPNATVQSSMDEDNDGPPTGLFAPQLPTSPMDQKYPPRALPRGEYADDAETETTCAIAQVVGSSAAHPMGEQGGANLYKDAQDWSEGESQVTSLGDSGMTHGEEVENDEFMLRLSLMRYANPLMSKVVIFSALYRLFRFSEQDWIELRHHSLARLIEELEERYPNLIDLEMKLCGVAEQLEVPEQAMQTVAALLKVLKPRYASTQQAPARNLGLAMPSPDAATTSEPIPKPSQDLNQEAALFTQAERATAIQFGPDGASGNQESAIAAQPISPGSSTSPHAVIAEVLPSDEVSYEALLSDDLEADLALLAASLEDDGPSLPHDS